MFLTIAMVEPLALARLSVPAPGESSEATAPTGISAEEAPAFVERSRAATGPALVDLAISPALPAAATERAAAPDAGSARYDGSANLAPRTAQVQTVPRPEAAPDSAAVSAEVADQQPAVSPAPAPAPAQPTAAPQGEKTEGPETAAAIQFAPGQSASTQTTEAALSSPQSARKLRYGLGLDLGFSGPLPDAGLLLTLRPTSWLRLQMGGGYNVLSFGLRGGATVVNPFFVPVSLTCEGGHYFDGDANRAVRWFSDGSRDIASLRQFSYDYLNLLGGYEFERRHVTIYIRAGVTWMGATVKDFQQSVYDATQVDLQASNPRVTYRGPTVKVGIVYFP